MKSTQYLFGIDASELSNKFYEEAIRYKIDAGAKLYRELESKQGLDFKERERLFYVTKALDFTRDLLEELKEA